jgi:hypothetical protein
MDYSSPSEFSDSYSILSDRRIYSYSAMERNAFPDIPVAGGNEVALGPEHLNLTGDSYPTSELSMDYYGCTITDMGYMALDSRPLEKRWPLSTTGLTGEQVADMMREAARQAKEWSGSTSEFTFITDQAIAQAMEGSDYVNWAERTKAVQSVLDNFLREHSSGVYGPQAEVDAVFEVLREAACQITPRISADPYSQDNVPDDICYDALLMTFTKANPNPEATVSLPVKKEEVERKVHACLAPECNNRVYHRLADLQRHNSMRHMDSEPKSYSCDYRKCPRRETPFFRKDHFRDHLRDYHKEDLIGWSINRTKDSWESRPLHAMPRGWWRCGRCLAHRVIIATDGYSSCPGCGYSLQIEH